MLVLTMALQLHIKGQLDCVTLPIVTSNTGLEVWIDSNNPDGVTVITVDRMSGVKRDEAVLLLEGQGLTVLPN